MRSLITLALVAAAFPVFADGNSDTATAKAKVHIVAPVKVMATGEINFGQIVVDDVTQDASVTMITHSAPGMYSTATLTDWNKCAPYAKNNVAVTPAEFHFSQDIQADVAAQVKITVDPEVTLAGGYGPDVKLVTNNDLPADTCMLATIDGQTAIAGYVGFQHFGVGGVLQIPAGALGKKEGTLNVKVEYM